MSQFIHDNINIIIIIIVFVVVVDNAESMMQKQKSVLHSQSVQSVRRTQVTCNPKMNFIHFSAIELRGEFKI